MPTQPSIPAADAVVLDRTLWGHREVAVRCEAARAAGLRGTPSDLPHLVERALEDRSIAVRLAASTAAADVLSRYRAPGALPEADAAALWSTLRPLDPGRNPGLLQVCGELRRPEATRRLFAALRDGRHDVRVGAIIGLHRHAASGWCDPGLEQQVLDAAADRAVPADTRAALVRLCADVGWTAIAPVAEALAASDLENVAATAAEALDWVRTPHPVDGLWADTGRDAWEAGLRTAAPRAVWAFVLGTPKSDRVAVVDGEGAASWRSLGGAVRTLRLSVDGAPRARVVLVGARLLVPATVEDRARFLDALVDAGANEILDAVDPLLPPDATTLRARGRRALRDGDALLAREILRAAALLPRAPADLSAWLARADAALGIAAEPSRTRKRRPPER